MMYMLIIASALALAVASPTRGVVNPGPAGPAPTPDINPIEVGPGILDSEPVAIGPVFVDPAVPVEEIATPVAPAPVVKPVIQIILNINGQVVSIPDIVVPGTPIAVAPGDVDIVDSAPEAVDVGQPVFVPEPVVIGTPTLPEAAVILPEELN